MASFRWLGSIRNSSASPLCRQISGSHNSRTRSPPRSNYSRSERSAVVPPSSLRRSPCLQSSAPTPTRSEEHTSELQSLRHLVCRLLLEKKRKNKTHEQAREPREHHPPQPDGIALT